MALCNQTPTEVTADVDLWVPRGEMGDLPSGIRAVLEAVDAIETAEVLDVSDVRPRTTDICVTATAWLIVDAEGTDAEAITRLLEDGFGVLAVDPHVVEPVD
jgi:hypothetical protein